MFHYCPHSDRCNVFTSVYPFTGGLLLVSGPLSCPGGVVLSLVSVLSRGKVPPFWGMEVPLMSGHWSFLGSGSIPGLWSFVLSGGGIPSLWSLVPLGYPRSLVSGPFGVPLVSGPLSFLGGTTWIKWGTPRTGTPLPPSSQDRHD